MSEIPGTGSARVPGGQQRRSVKLCCRNSISCRMYGKAVWQGGVSESAKDYIERCCVRTSVKKRRKFKWLGLQNFICWWNVNPLYSNVTDTGIFLFCVKLEPSVKNTYSEAAGERYSDRNGFYHLKLLFFSRGTYGYFFVVLRFLILDYAIFFRVTIQSTLMTIGSLERLNHWATAL